MTFGLGMKCDEGLLAIADTQLTTGTIVSKAKKISVHQAPTHAMFVLTSGLRSVRDKAITYFEDRLAADEQGLGRLYKAANALAEEIRRVYNEDHSWLASSGLTFDLSCIIGGQMEEDTEDHLFLLYPQGNWIELDPGSPYVMIGESTFGKPLLDRFWRFDRSLEEALLVGLLAFDATRTSASSVSTPVDAAIYYEDSGIVHERRFNDEDLAPLNAYWRTTIVQGVENAHTLTAPLFKALVSAPPRYAEVHAQGHPAQALGSNPPPQP